MSPSCTGSLPHTAKRSALMLTRCGRSFLPRQLRLCAVFHGGHRLPHTVLIVPVRFRLLYALSVLLNLQDENTRQDHERSRGAMVCSGSGAGGSGLRGAAFRESPPGATGAAIVVPRTTSDAIAYGGDGLPQVQRVSHGRHACILPHGRGARAETGCGGEQGKRTLYTVGAERSCSSTCGFAIRLLRMRRTAYWKRGDGLRRPQAACSRMYSA